VWPNVSNLKGGFGRNNCIYLMGRGTHEVLQVRIEEFQESCRPQRCICREKFVALQVYVGGKMRVGDVRDHDAIGGLDLPPVPPNGQCLCWRPSRSSFSAEKHTSLIA
jgi:hypothetical protein